MEVSYSIACYKKRIVYIIVNIKFDMLYLLQ